MMYVIQKAGHVAFGRVVWHIRYLFSCAYGRRICIPSASTLPECNLHQNAPALGSNLVRGWLSSDNVGKPLELRVARQAERHFALVSRRRLAYQLPVWRFGLTSGAAEPWTG